MLFFHSTKTTLGMFISLIHFFFQNQFFSWLNTESIEINLKLKNPPRYGLNFYNLVEFKWVLAPSHKQTNWVRDDCFSSYYISAFNHFVVEFFFVSFFINVKFKLLVEYCTKRERDFLNNLLRLEYKTEVNIRKCLFTMV